MMLGGSKRFQARVVRHNDCLQDIRLVLVFFSRSESKTWGGHLWALVGTLNLGTSLHPLPRCFFLDAISKCKVVRVVCYRSLEHRASAHFYRTHHMRKRPSRCPNPCLCNPCAPHLNPRPHLHPRTPSPVSRSPQRSSPRAKRESMSEDVSERATAAVVAAAAAVISTLYCP